VRWPGLWVGAAAVLMASLDLGRRILATNDEARFAILAQDMLTRGAWLFPQLNGVDYNMKPPLGVWLIGLASWPVGRVTQLTAVLPSALAAVGIALLVHAVGRKMFDAATGFFAALITITTQGWFLHARMPMPDMVVTFFITAAVGSLWPMGRALPGRWWIGFYGCMAAAFWAKGAVALLPLAVALCWRAVSARPSWRALRLPAGGLLFVLLIAPWWIGKLASQSDAMRAVVVKDNLVWYLPRSASMLAGPPQHLIGIFFPWALLIPLVAWQVARAVRERRPERDALVFVALWAGAFLLFVGVSQQQRLRYYVPLIPPMALATGWWASRASAGSLAHVRIPGRLYALAGAVVAVATGVAAVIRRTWATGAHVAFPTSALETGVLAAGLLMMLGSLFYGVRRGRLTHGFAAACLGGAVWVAGWYHWELERRNAAYDYPRVRAEVRRLLPGSPVVASSGVYYLPMSFYLGHQVDAIWTDDDLRRVMSEHPRGSALVTEAALARAGDLGRLRVLPLERLNFDPVVLVSHSADGVPADVRR